ncbi:hypothetical protein P7K49_007275 [Saguinus oedipus]|uniref:GMP reductase n=1 Tax=Saguinus oedipus TaxID=9490 RepID=A0ABQ9VUE9_SAGOE|nr:hypothetical protein P7K49_007275 [Saguinus oedipus]
MRIEDSCGIGEAGKGGEASDSRGCLDGRISSAFCWCLIKEGEEPISAFAPGSSGFLGSSSVFGIPVDLERTFTFRNSKQTYSGIPIIVANMDTVGTFEMAAVMSQRYKEKLDNMKNAILQKSDSPFQMKAELFCMQSVLQHLLYNYAEYMYRCPCFGKNKGNPVGGRSFMGEVQSVFCILDVECLLRSGHSLFTAIHKHYSLDDWKLFAANHPECLQVRLQPDDQLRHACVSSFHIRGSELKPQTGLPGLEPLPADQLIYDGKMTSDRSHVAVSSGSGQNDLEKMSSILDAVPQVKFICLDVANGYSEHFVEFVKLVRAKFPEHTIMVSTVGHSQDGEATRELLIVSGGAEFASELSVPPQSKTN